MKYKLIEGKATLPWAIHPIVVDMNGRIVDSPSEEITVYSSNEGETWFIPYGIHLKKKWLIVKDIKPYSKPDSLFTRARKYLA